MRNRTKVNIIFQLYVLCMDAENCFASLHIGAVHYNLTVKTTRAEKRRIKNVRTVRSRKHNESFFIVKAVHLNEKLVQRLFAFIITAEIVRTAFSDGVYFINKDDTWSLFTRRLKQITHTACTYTYEHLNEIRTADTEERNAGFTCYCAGKKRFAGSGRSYKKDTFRNFSADIGVFFRLLEKVYNFYKFFLCFVNACNIGKTGFHIAFVDRFCTGLTGIEYASHAAAHAVPHLSENEKVHDQDQTERKNYIEQNLHEIIILFYDEFIIDAFLIEQRDKAVSAYKNTDRSVFRTVFLLRREQHISFCILIRRHCLFRTVTDEIRISHLDRYDFSVFYKLAEFREAHKVFRFLHDKNIHQRKYGQ